jgi:hypothetical protein
MGVQQANPAVERQAKLLAAENRQSEPDITRILWFRDDGEVRLLEVTDQVPASMDGEVHPFYFRPSAKDDLPLPSAIVMIRADEVGKLRLPPTWGSWTDAVEL